MRRFILLGLSLIILLGADYRLPTERQLALKLLSEQTDQYYAAAPLKMRTVITGKGAFIWIDYYRFNGYPAYVVFNQKGEVVIHIYFRPLFHPAPYGYTGFVPILQIDG